jgi:EF hand
MKAKQNKLLQISSILSAAALAVGMGAAVAQTMPAKPAPTAPSGTPGSGSSSSSSTAPTTTQSTDTLFKRIDTDADGTLSKAELEKFDPEAAKSFEKYDADKDAKLSLSEFDTMVKGLRAG